MDQTNAQSISSQALWMQSSEVILLISFGLLPIDIDGLDIPRWVVGVIGGVWFLGAVGFLAYQLTRTDASE